MILTDQQIRDAKIITPFVESTRTRGMSGGLSYVGYDVHIDLPEDISISAGQFKLFGVREHFSMPPDVVAFMHPKSTWARQGLMLQTVVLEPGWKGFLTIGLHAFCDVQIHDGDPIAQIVFHRIESIPERTYSGSYQGQGRGPQGPRFQDD